MKVLELNRPALDSMMAPTQGNLDPSVAKRQLRW